MIDGVAACDGAGRINILDEAGFLAGVLSFLCNKSERSVCMVPTLSETWTMMAPFSRVISSPSCRSSPLVQ
jgi:hypothetical protein